MKILPNERWARHLSYPAGDHAMIIKLGVSENGGMPRRHLNGKNVEKIGEFPTGFSDLTNPLPKPHTSEMV